MSAVVDRVVAATLYEGYLLYPYRSTSVKNKVRWTFGGIHPRAYSESTGGSEPWVAQTECLLSGTAERARVSVRLRFLQPVTRTVAALDHPVPEPDGQTAALLRDVDALRVGEAVHRPWQEAVEHDLEVGELVPADLAVAPHVFRRTIESARETEWVRDEAGVIVGALLRSREPLDVEATVAASAAGEGISRIGVTVRNRTEIGPGAPGDREHVLLRSLVSAHVILVAEGAIWLSLADPPAEAEAAAASCTNTGMWPVLIGERGAADTVLASPIILDDHPQVAPESAGDLFDATEIDEILSLRILTLSESEKSEMRTADPRAAAMLERTENLTAEEWMRLHGIIREPEPGTTR